MISLRFRVWWSIFVATAFGVMLRGDTIVTLSLPTVALKAGSEAQGELVVVNSADAPATFAVPASIAGRLSDGTREWPVELHLTGSKAVIPARGFVRAPLTLTLPPGVGGRLILELEQPAKLRAVVDVLPGEWEASPLTMADLAGSEVVKNSPVTLSSATRIRQYYADHFSAHEPMYFLFGAEEPAAKFQVSLKYRLLNDTGPLATWLPALRGLHVGYTQRSLWDITSVSSPFFDSSYMPELLFQSLADGDPKATGFSWVGWQAAFQHESNGRDGAMSRSLNTFYFRPMMSWAAANGWRLTLRPKFFLYSGDLSDNPDIEHFRGYSEVRAILGYQNRLTLSLTGRLGDDFEKGSLQVDASYPTAFMTGNFAMFLHLQYWVGYGESLLKYNTRTETIRAGFSLAR